MSDLTEAEREELTRCDCGHDIGGEHNSYGCYGGGPACGCSETDDRVGVNFAAVERIVAERVRVVEGERDAEVAEAEREHEKTLAIMEAACDRADALQARAESAEAAHEAEKAAHEQLRAVAESIAYEHAATVDAEFGCCHDEDALRAGGRIAEFDGDEFEPIPPDCLGQKTLDQHLALLGGGEAR